MAYPVSLFENVLSIPSKGQANNAGVMELIVALAEFSRFSFVIYSENFHQTSPGVSREWNNSY